MTQAKGLYDLETRTLTIVDLERGPAIVIVVLAALIIWVLFRQWERTRWFMEKHPFTGSIIEAVLFVFATYTIHGIIILVGTLPRFRGWTDLTLIGAEFVLHLGWAVAIARIFEGVVHKKRADKPDWHVSRLSRVGFYSFFILLGAAAFFVSDGDTPTGLFVWTGATAAVLAFVMQQTLGDFFSGLALTIERPFKIGDWLRLEDGTEGQVEDMTWRATRLRKWDKTSYVIPNGQLASQSFTNLYGARHSFAPWYTVKVSNEHAPALVIALLEQATRTCKIPSRDPEPVVRLMDAGSSPYTYMIWVQFPNYPTMFAGRDELYRAIDDALRSADIEIATDIQEIRLRDFGKVKTPSG
ncbi:mechanosensitive ion channel family protein [Ruegeria pomeroyi]|nr:mechanosensitive ion channel family protein [Ruegeria pomeroyi]